MALQAEALSAGHAIDSAIGRLLPFREGEGAIVDQSRGLREPRQLRDGSDLKLGRDGGAVELHRSLVDAKVGRDLLVEPSFDDLPQDCELARRERTDANLQ